MVEITVEVTGFLVLLHAQIKKNRDFQSANHRAASARYCLTQNLKMESVNLSADNHTSDVTWLSRKAKGCHCWHNPLLSSHCKLLVFVFTVYIFQMSTSDDSDSNTSYRSVSEEVEGEIEDDFGVVGDLVEPYRFEPISPARLWRARGRRRRRRFNSGYIRG